MKHPSIHSMRRSVIRIVLALMILAAGGIFVNYTPLHAVTLASGRISLSGMLTALGALFTLTLHTIGFGIIARREITKRHPLSLGLWVAFFLLTILVSFSLGIRFAADEIRSFGEPGTLPPVAEALALFDEPISHSLLIVGWMLMVFVTIIVEMRNPPDRRLPRKDRDIAIAGGSIAGVLGGIAVIEGQVWWIALPVAIVLAGIIVWQARGHHESLWSLPATLFGLFGFVALAIFTSIWGLYHGGFPEIRKQPLRFFDQIERSDLIQLQEYLDELSHRLEQAGETLIRE